MLPGKMQAAALGLIKDAKQPERFEDAPSQRKHRAVLQALADRLRSAQPKKPARKPPYIEECDFAIGEVLAHPLPRGRWALLRVAYFTRFRGESPICEALAWNVAAIPPAAKIKTLRFMRRRASRSWASSKKEEMLAGVIEHKRLPKGRDLAGLRRPVFRTVHPGHPISERDPHFHKIVRMGVNTPSERPFHSDWWVATNAWTTWKTCGCAWRAASPTRSAIQG